MATARSINFEPLPKEVADKRLAQTFASMRATAAKQNEARERLLLRDKKAIYEMRRKRK